MCHAVLKIACLLQALQSKASAVHRPITANPSKAAPFYVHEPPRFSEPSICISPSGAPFGVLPTGLEKLECSGESQLLRSVNSQGLVAAAAIQGSPAASGAHLTRSSYFWD
jgi:hypothetical protein